MVSVLHCVPTTQSQIVYCLHVFDALYSLLPLYPLSSANPLLLSVCMSFFVCLFFLFTHSLLSVLYVAYE